MQTPTMAGRDVVLSPSGGEPDPDLGALGGVQAVCGVGPTTVTSTGGGGLSASDVQALLDTKRQREALEAREAELREKVARERETLLAEAARQKRAEVAALWAQMAPLLADGGPEAERAVAAFLRDWEQVDVVARDVEGEHRRVVSIPQVSQAREPYARHSTGEDRPWGATQSAPVSTSAGADPRSDSAIAAVPVADTPSFPWLYVEGGVSHGAYSYEQEACLS